MPHTKQPSHGAALVASLRRAEQIEANRAGIERAEKLVTAQRSAGYTRYQIAQVDAQKAREAEHEMVRKAHYPRSAPPAALARREALQAETAKIRRQMKGNR